MIAFNFVDAAQVAAFFLAGFLPAVGAVLWRISTLQKKLETLEARLQSQATLDDLWSLTERVERAERRLGGQALLQSLWDDFVGTSGGNLVALANRVDLHAGLLDRMLESVPIGIDRTMAIRADTEIANDCRRSLAELELFYADDARRKSAALTLADGLGDQRSLSLMTGELAAVDPMLSAASRRLAARLFELERNGP